MQVQHTQLKAHYMLHVMCPLACILFTCTPLSVSLATGLLKECGARALIIIIISIVPLLILLGVFSVHVDAESTFEAILHSKIELKCIVDAVLTPNIIWYRLNINDEVTKLVHTQEAGDPKYGILERNVTREDDGKWRCAVSSSYGGKESDFVITVIGT